DRWPTGQTRQTAVLRMAQTLHASYDGAPYDASVLESARSYFEDYQMQYPQEASRLEVAQTLALITEQLAYKEYEMGFYYERTGSMAAAEQYYNKVIKEWPDSKAAQMAKARLLPDAASPIKMNIRRRAVNGTTKFLDSWFGVESLFDKVLPADEDKSEISPDVLDDGMVVDEYIELDDGMIVDEYIEMSP
ncbi:MAG: outer membrane protein assembly factor BamD, partial [Planctomycetota bacterium]